jgi:hypothetical protein
VSTTLLLLAAIGCFTFSLFLTYGVGGAWRHHGQQWRFYQPGVGGPSFIVLQVMNGVAKAALQRRIVESLTCWGRHHDTFRNTGFGMDELLHCRLYFSCPPQQEAGFRFDRLRSAALP